MSGLNRVGVLFDMARLYSQMLTFGPQRGKIRASGAVERRDKERWFAVAATSRWSLRNIYLYLVCLITLIMVIVAAVGLVRNVVELAYPDPGYYDRPMVSVDGETKQSEEEAAAQQKLWEDQALRNAVLGLVGNGAMLLIAGPLYLYHWRKIEGELTDEGAVATEG